MRSCISFSWGCNLCLLSACTYVCLHVCMPLVCMYVHAACGMWRVACGMWRVACGMWHVHVYGMCVWRVACGLCMCVLHVRVCVSPPSPAVHHATAEEEAVEGEQRAVRLPLAEGEAPAVKAHSSAAGPYDGFGRVAWGWTLPRRLKDM